MNLRLKLPAFLLSGMYLLSWEEIGEGVEEEFKMTTEAWLEDCCSKQKVST